MSWGGGKLLGLKNPPAGSHFSLKGNFAPCRAPWVLRLRAKGMSSKTMAATATFSCEVVTRIFGKVR